MSTPEAEVESQSQERSLQEFTAAPLTLPIVLKSLDIIGVELDKRKAVLSLDIVAETASGKRLTIPADHVRNTIVSAWNVIFQQSREKLNESYRDASVDWFGSVRYQDDHVNQQVRRAILEYWSDKTESDLNSPATELTLNWGPSEEVFGDKMLVSKADSTGFKIFPFTVPGSTCKSRSTKDPGALARNDVVIDLSHRCPIRYSRSFPSAVESSRNTHDTINCPPEFEMHHSVKVYLPPNLETDFQNTLEKFVNINPSAETLTDLEYYGHFGEITPRLQAGVQACIKEWTLGSGIDCSEARAFPVIHDSRPMECIHAKIPEVTVSNLADKAKSWVAANNLDPRVSDHPEDDVDDSAVEIFKTRNDVSSAVLSQIEHKRPSYVSLEGWRDGLVQLVQKAGKPAYYYGDEFTDTNEYHGEGEGRLWWKVDFDGLTGLEERTAAIEPDGSAPSLVLTSIVGPAGHPDIFFQQSFTFDIKSDGLHYVEHATTTQTPDHPSVAEGSDKAL